MAGSLELLNLLDAAMFLELHVELLQVGHAMTVALSGTALMVDEMPQPFGPEATQEIVQGLRDA